MRRTGNNQTSLFSPVVVLALLLIVACMACIAPPEQATAPPGNGILEDIVPAAKAGMRQGDVITHFEGEEVTEATQLIKALWRHQVGDRVEITFWRGQEEEKAVVELTVERP